MVNLSRKKLSQNRGDATILFAVGISALLVGSAYLASLGPVQSQRQLDQLRKRQTLQANNLSALEVTKALVSTGALNTSTARLESGANPNDLLGNIYCAGASPSTPQSWETGLAPSCPTTGVVLQRKDPLALESIWASLGSMFIAPLNLLQLSAWAGVSVGVKETASRVLTALHVSSSSHETTFDAFPTYEAGGPTLLLNFPSEEGAKSTAFVEFGSSAGGTVDVSVTSVVPSGTRWTTASLVARLAQPTPTVTNWTPQSCVLRVAESVSYQGVLSTNVGFSSCPAHYAIVTTGNGAAYNFVCCPLAANDILTGPITERNGTCSANELIVGSSYSDNNSARVSCQKINTTKYKLGNTENSCNWGNGSSGSTGAAACGSYPVITGGQYRNIPVKVVGNDGCTGSPFGTFAVKRTTKQCGAQSYAPLLTLDNTPVPILYP